ncbi:hypothetical protein N7456_013049 [Penicillium angulare]|uniref:Uncharacterized protein n=1 Tax=Penicillium angulare TaxID=116970 RepID=A0A9W9EKQ2_9EURO|nr:hypothetical protein N7456_013049 [Penicillium angulare]
MQLDSEASEPLMDDCKRDVTRSYKIRPVIIGVIAAILSLAVFISIAKFLQTPLPYKISTSTTETCGESREEARALGCHFDPVSFSWLPSSCYDGDLTEEFLGLKDWEWFVDSDGSSASRDTVMEGGYDELYVSWEYHLLHCTYAWRKMHRAILSGRPMDNYIAKYNHTAHCEHMLLAQWIERNTTNTIIQTKFVSC